MARVSSQSKPKKASSAAAKKAPAKKPATKKAATKKPATKKAAKATAKPKRDPAIRAAIELVATSPKRAFTAAREIVRKLGDVPASVALLDEIADLGLAKSPQWAGEAFYTARAVERKLGLAASAAHYVTFAKAGALDPRELMTWLGSVDRKKAQREIAAVVSASAPTSELLRTIREIGGDALLEIAFQGWVERLGAKVPVSVWAACKTAAKRCLVDDPALAQALLASAEESSNALAGLELLRFLVPFHTPAKVLDAAIRLVHQNVREETLTALALVLAEGKDAEVSVIPNPMSDGEADLASWSRQLVDPAIVELLLRTKAKVHLPKGSPETYTFSLHAWEKRSTTFDSFEQLGAHEFFGRVLRTSFLPRRETKDLAGQWLAKAVSRPGCKAVVREIAEYVARIPKQWTLGAFEVHSSWLEGLLRPELFEHAPEIAQAVGDLDPARLLANQLRAGILDEWGWPAWDEALDRLGDEIDAPRSGPLPFAVLHSRKEQRLIAVGPDEIVLDRVYEHPSKQTVLRGAFVVDGDVLACAWSPTLGHWVKGGGAPFQMDPYDVFDIAVDGALLTKGHAVVERGGTNLLRRPDGRGAGRRAWFDGERWFDVTQECVVDVNGNHAKHRGRPAAPIEVFDPKTGEALPPAVPRWIAALMTDPQARLIAHIETTFTAPVPSGAEASPLGAKNGLGGFALLTQNGDAIAHGIDGRSAPGLVNGLVVAGLMTFPEREGFYPLVGSAFDLGIALPDGTPLVPTQRLQRSGYWAGTRGALRLPWFHLLRPRDRAGSRALLKTTIDQARALLAVATAPEREPEVVKDYGNMQAVLEPAATVTAASPALLAAVAEAFPEITHPRLRAGVAGVARVAVEHLETITRLQSRLGTRTKESGSTLLNADAAAVARLFDHAMHWWIEKLGTDLGAQIEDVADFLFGGELASTSLTPAPTVFPWEMIVTRLGELLYRVRAPGTPRAAQHDIARVLTLWAETPFADNAHRMRLVVLRLPPSDALAGMDREHPDRLVAFEDRFFLRFRGRADGHIIARGIHVGAADGAFRLPPGAELLESHAAEARFSAAAIRAALATPLSFERSVAERIATSTGLSLPSATLLWAAGYDPWLVAETTRETLGLSRKDIDLAEVELEGKRLREIYTRATPDDPDALASAWNDLFGHKAPLPVALVEEMRADLKQDLPFERDARTLLEPDAADVLAKDETWVLRPMPALDAGKRRFEGFLPAGWPLALSMAEGDHNPDRDAFFNGYALTRFVRYLAWAHLALPGGAPARKGAARIGALLRERLANPALLLLAGIVDLSTTDETGTILGIKGKVTEREGVRGFVHVTSRFEGAPYSAPDGGPAPLGSDRGDAIVTWPEAKNGVFLSYRPSKLTDDDALLRFLDDVGAGESFRRTNGGSPCNVAFGELPVIAPAAFAHWLTWRTPAFQRLVDALGEPLPEGRFATDPRVSAPEAVAALRTRRGLDEDAATLWLEETALPDPSRERILRVNGWSAATYEAAREKLTKLSRRPTRALYGISEADEPVFGVLLPLRPFAEIYADAARA